MTDTQEVKSQGADFQMSIIDTPLQVWEAHNSAKHRLEMAYRAAYWELDHPRFSTLQNEENEMGTSLSPLGSGSMQNLFKLSLSFQISYQSNMETVLMQLEREISCKDQTRCLNLSSLKLHQVTRQHQHQLNKQISSKEKSKIILNNSKCNHKCNNTPSPSHRCMARNKQTTRFSITIWRSNRFSSHKSMISN